MPETLHQGAAALGAPTVDVNGIDDAAPARGDEATEAWYSAMAGVIVAGLGLLVLLAIVGIALVTLPTESKDQNVIALSTSAFGVIGAIVGAYFGVRSANRAIDAAHKR